MFDCLRFVSGLVGYWSLLFLVSVLSLILFLDRWDSQSFSLVTVNQSGERRVFGSQGGEVLVTASPRVPEKATDQQRQIEELQKALEAANRDRERLQQALERQSVDLANLEQELETLKARGSQGVESAHLLEGEKQSLMMAEVTLIEAPAVQPASKLGEGGALADQVGTPAANWWHVISDSLSVLQCCCDQFDMFDEAVQHCCAAFETYRVGNNLFINPTMTPAQWHDCVSYYVQALERCRLGAQTISTAFDHMGSYLQLSYKWVEVQSFCQALSLAASAKKLMGQAAMNRLENFGSSLG